MFAKASWVTKILGVGFLGIMALLPFHAFFTTWFISNVGAETIIKSWKELLLIVVLMPITLWILSNNPKIVPKLWQRLVNKLIAAYLGLNILLALIFSNARQAEIAGLVFNLRFLAMFVLAQVLVELLPPKKLKDMVLNIVFAGGLLVVAFGALQVLLLPNDFLRHFGYAKDIIPPYFTVDNNEAVVRILSTLRGPNALGAYLVFWLPILAYVTQKVYKINQNWQIWAVLVWAASLLTLYGSRSRSAWLGAFIALFIYAFVQLNKEHKKLLLIGVAVAMGSFLLVIAWQWNSFFVQSTLLHRDPKEQSSINSDEQRTNSLSEAARTVAENPLGQGPGSKGLASTYSSSPNIVENYYLQVASELGLFGLALFVAISILVFVLLWRQRHDGVILALSASFIGLFIVNLLLPAWGDETLSMLWWGMAGLFVFSGKTLRDKKSSIRKQGVTVV